MTLILVIVVFSGIVYLIVKDWNKSRPGGGGRTGNSGTIYPHQQ